jgi:hypothetical protein
MPSSSFGMASPSSVVFGTAVHTIVLSAVTAGILTGVQLAQSYDAAIAGCAGFAAFAVGEWLAFGVVWFFVARRERSALS